MFSNFLSTESIDFKIPKSAKTMVSQQEDQAKISKFKDFFNDLNITIEESEEDQKLKITESIFIAGKDESLEKEKINLLVTNDKSDQELFNEDSFNIGNVYVYLNSQIDTECKELVDNLLPKTKIMPQLIVNDNISEQISQIEATDTPKIVQNNDISLENIIPDNENKSYNAPMPIEQEYEAEYLFKMPDVTTINDSKTNLEISFKNKIINQLKREKIFLPEEQISMSLKYAISQNKNEVRINLHPKSLGAIDVKIDFSKNNSGKSELQKVTIITNQPSTLRILENTKHHLEIILNELKKEAEININEISKKDPSLQLDMRNDSNEGETGAGYFNFSEEKENWMNQFRNLLATENSVVNIDLHKSKNNNLTKININNLTNIDIEV